MVSCMLFEYVRDTFLIHSWIVGFKLRIGHSLLEKLTVSNQVGKPPSKFHCCFNNGLILGLINSQPKHSHPII